MSSSGRGLKRPLSQIASASHDQELSRMKLLVEELKVEHENARQRDLLNLRNAEGKVDKLQRHLEFLTSEEEAAKAAQRRNEELHLKQKHQLEKTILDYQKRLAETEARVQDTSGVDEQKKLRHDLEIAQVEMQSLRKQNAACQEEKERCHQEIGRLKQEAIKASMPSSARKPFAPLAETPGSVMGSARELREQIRESEARERQLKLQLHEAQESARNASIMEEKVEQLQSRLRKAEGVIAEYSVKEVKFEEMLAEKKEWQVQFSKLLSDRADGAGAGATSETSPMQAVKVLQAMRQEKVVLHRHMGELQSHLREAEARAEEAEKKVVQEGSRRATAEAKTTELEDKLATLTNQMVYVSKRKESLEKLLQSYDTEFKMLPPGGSSGSSAMQSQAQAVLEKRVASLEAALEAAEQQARSLKQESEVRTPPAMLAKARERAREMEAACTAAEAAKAKVLRQLEKTEGELAALEARLGRGEYDKSKTKVVHFAANPSQMLYQRQKEKKQQAEAAAADAETLIKENEELRAKVKLLEESSATAASLGSGAVTPHHSRSSGSIAPPSTGGSAETVDSLKLRNQRLIEMFRNKLQTFREAVYLTTGYKIDMTQSATPQIRLRSMYAEREEDDLLFQMSGKGMELLETDFCKKLDKDVFAYLTKCDSIPAFLSTITTYLFDRQTITFR